MNSHVVILGTGPTSRGDAPYDDLSVDIWTIARGLCIPPRVSLLFELHAPALWDGWGDKEGKVMYAEVLRQWDETDIMMQEAYPEIGAARKFPKDEVLAHLGDKPYQTSQVSWMMGYAMYLGYKEISFYGVDLVSEGEARSYQRHCLEYLIGVARGRGHIVNIAEKSSLCKNRTAKEHALYGYDYPLTRDEAVYYYGHPMRQLVTDKDGKLIEVREVPGLLGMPVVKEGGESEMRIVSTLPESIKGLHDLSNKLQQEAKEAHA